MWSASSNRMVLVTIIALSASSGCDHSDLSTKIIFGTVTVDGQKPDCGQLRFVPIEGTPGPASFGLIVDGQYRIEARGGVPVGKHRVEIDARVETGRQVRGYAGLEEAMVDETVSMLPVEYANDQSPFVAEIRADGESRIDITVDTPCPPER